MNEQRPVYGTSSSSTTDRRAHYRYYINQKLCSSIETFSLMKGRHLYDLHGHIDNISQGGLKFTTKQDIHFVTEDIVNIIFTWHKQECVFTGKIVWKALDSGFYNIGIAFGRETKKSEALLNILEDLQ
ncbi:PilZ domain-containing protein [Pontibacillus sp. HMF3514]|uniref:PilZ domain-containing protein n=1 Tax=Pontibacillus sp. HMF3514 TaxID=2692425 RepID=UPI00131F89BF|nr:PilZ domain-containing protein [Pontibacillus sp. HMF3514]QHE52447.1 hypothetical protein GS400_10565 [Pontibacillus sp. HMF3514]